MQVHGFPLVFLIVAIMDENMRDNEVFVSGTRVVRSVIPSNEIKDNTRMINSYLMDLSY